MRRILGIGLAVMCGIGLAGIGMGPAAAQSVSAGNFTKQVCAAIATADQGAKASAATFKAAVKAYKTTPSATTAAAMRDALTQEAQDLDQQFANLLTSIQQAGTPANATDFVTALTSALETQRVAAQELARHSAAIDTSSATAFATSVQQIVDETKTAGAQARASAKSNPAFKSAPRALRPLVRVLTSTADTCAKT